MPVSVCFSFSKELYWRFISLRLFLASLIVWCLTLLNLTSRQQCSSNFFFFVLSFKILIIDMLLLLYFLVLDLYLRTWGQWPLSCLQTHAVAPVLRPCRTVRKKPCDPWLPDVRSPSPVLFTNARSPPPPLLLSSGLCNPFFHMRAKRKIPGRSSWIASTGSSLALGVLPPGQADETPRPKARCGKSWRARAVWGAHGPVSCQTFSCYILRHICPPSIFSLSTSTTVYYFATSPCVSVFFTVPFCISSAISPI